MEKAGGGATRPLRLLHVGAGRESLPDWLPDVDEYRLDVDPDTKPDFVASMTDMGAVGTYDVIYASHCVEHLYSYEVQAALGEFLRALDSGGLAIVLVPDLEDIRPDGMVVYESPAGPVTGLDMFYGYGAYLEHIPHMAHHCGFVRETLTEALEAAGFGDVRVSRDRGSYQLLALATK